MEEKKEKGLIGELFELHKLGALAEIGKTLADTNLVDITTYEGMPSEQYTRALKEAKKYCEGKKIEFSLSGKDKRLVFFSPQNEEVGWILSGYLNKKGFKVYRGPFGKIYLVTKTEVSDLNEWGNIMLWITVKTVADYLPALSKSDDSLTDTLMFGAGFVAKLGTDLSADYIISKYGLDINESINLHKTLQKFSKETGAKIGIPE